MNSLVGPAVTRQRMGLAIIPETLSIPRLMESENQAPAPQRQENLFYSILFNILAPVLLLTQGDKFIDGPAIVLVLALAFPVVYFFYDLRRRAKKNIISIIGFVSVLLTGGVGLLELPRFWFIVKETAIPAIIGIAILASLKTRFPLVRTFLFSPQVFDVERIQSALRANNAEKRMERLLWHSTVMLSASFFLSAILNFIVASHFIQTEPRDNPAQFNAEVGAMTGWSYLIIALPCTVIMMGILFYLIGRLRKLTGLHMDDLVAEHARTK